MDHQKALKTGILLGGVAVAMLLSFMIGKQVGGAGRVPSVAKADANLGESAASPTVAARRLSAEPITPPSAFASAADNPPTAVPEIPRARIQAAGADGTSDQLTSTREKLKLARTAMNGATAKNHGGYVEKIRADIDQAMSHMDEAVAFGKSHPELSGVPASASPDATAAAVRVKAIKFPQPNSQGHLVGSLKALQESLDALDQVGWGNLGGTREQVIMDIDHAAADLEAGFNYLQSGANKTAANGNTPPSPPPDGRP